MDVKVMIRKAERQDVPLLLEDGTVTLYSKDVGLEPRPQMEGTACSIDGRGC